MTAKSVQFSHACERNKQPILEVLRGWLPPGARVLEVGSGSGQHAVYFTQQLEGLWWQPSDLAANLPDLAERVSGEGGRALASGAVLAEPVALDVNQADSWPNAWDMLARLDGVGRRGFDAVFSANTTHIMAAAAVPRLLAGAAGVLKPGGLLLLYGPFQDGGVHTAASNAAFDAQLRGIDPAMGVRDAQLISEQARDLGLEALADVAMPANNRTLIFRRC